MLSVIAPVLFLGGVDALRQTAFDDQPYFLPGVLGFVVTYAAITLAVFTEVTSIGV
ncbi:MAG: hypothetical protein O3A47_06970 [Chloroflexi bacterium]|nr:hypothetical protein [Chloroflexota bacterium]